MTETERAIAIIEARLPLYTDIGQINAIRECISSIRSAALSAGQAQPVAIKPLEWEYAERKTMTYTAFWADGDVAYYIDQSFGSDSYYFRTIRWPEETIYDGDDLPSAKAAAQSDYEARIRSALSVPLPEIEGGDKGDAERFRALMRCGRIKMQGSAGVDPQTGERNGNNVHFGAEFWPEPIPAGYEEHYEASTKWGRFCIKALADAILEDEASRIKPSEAEGREG